MNETPPGHDRVLITFLGAGDYEPTSYTFDGQTADTPTPYVQEAIVRHLADRRGWRFGEGARCIVLVTELSRRKHWDALRQRLTGIAPGSAFTVKDIPEGGNEDELWRLFKVMTDAVAPGERLVMDITHSFRSLPFMAGAVANYLRAVKEVTCEAIFYGAYRRGEPGAPVVDLLPFIELERWTGAIGDFRRHGDFSRLRHVSHESVRPLLRDGSVVHENARQVNEALQKMDKLMTAIRYCRGKVIVEQASRLAHGALDALSGFRDEAVAPLHPLLSWFEEILTGFTDDDPVVPSLHAVDLCLEFGLVQQGLTILEETITNWVLFQMGITPPDLYSRERRQVVGSAYVVLDKYNPDYPDTWPADIRRERGEAVKELLDRRIITPRLVTLVKQVKQARNDINHFGMTDAMSPEKLRRSLEKTLAEFREIVSGA